MDQYTTRQRPDERESDAARMHGNSAFSFATSVLENSNDLVAAVDSQLCFVALNKPFRHEFELIFGIHVESGQRLDDVLAHLTNDRNKAASLCRRALAGESFRVIEDFGDDRLLRKSYELAFTPIFDTHQQPIYAAIVVRDLTMVRVSEQRFGALLEAAPDATIIMRHDGSIDLANAHAERMFGYGRHQMLGLSVERLVPERFRAGHIARRHQFELDPTSRPMGSGRTDLLGVRADGSEFPVEISLNPLDVGGENMVVAAIRDMTVRQRTEDQLRALSADLERRVAERTAELERAHKTFRTTFEQASVGIAHVAPSGKWLQVNQELCDLVGYSKEEMTTLTFQDITHPNDVDADLRLMYQVLVGNIPTYAIDKRYVRKCCVIYWHFKDKKDLFDAVTARTALSMEHVTSGIADSPPDDPLLCRLRAVCLSILKETSSNSHMCHTFTANLPKNTTTLLAGSNLLRRSAAYSPSNGTLKRLIG